MKVTLLVVEISCDECYRSIQRSVVAPPPEKLQEVQEDLEAKTMQLALDARWIISGDYNTCPNCK